MPRPLARLRLGLRPRLSSESCAFYGAFQRSLLRFFEKDPEALVRLYLSVPQLEAKVSACETALETAKERRKKRLLAKFGIKRRKFKRLYAHELEMLESILGDLKTG